jgi:hypothetical protein
MSLSWSPVLGVSRRLAIRWRHSGRLREEGCCALGKLDESVPSDFKVSIVGAIPAPDPRHMLNARRLPMLDRLIDIAKDLCLPKGRHGGARTCGSRQGARGRDPGGDSGVGMSADAATR